MAAYTIPKSIAVALTQIATLPDETIQDIRTALENIPLQIRQHHIFDDSEFKVASLSEEEARSIKEALLPLYSGLAAGKMSAESYVDDVTQSLKDVERGELNWTQSEEDVSRFKARLNDLLRINSVKLIAKAHDVLLEHEQTFSSSRILSDIRPVFGENVEDLPVAAVIVHNLNIVYFKGGTRREFVLALDIKDIPSLIETLERAKSKTESLKKIISSTNMTYIDVV
jgi:hypothetical protein